MELWNEWERVETQDSDEEKVHHNSRLEFAFYQAVSSGDIAYVQQNCEQQTFPDMSGVENCPEIL